MSNRKIFHERETYFFLHIQPSCMYCLYNLSSMVYFLFFCPVCLLAKLCLLRDSRFPWYHNSIGNGNITHCALNLFERNEHSCNTSDYYLIHYFIVTLNEITSFLSTKLYISLEISMCPISLYSRDVKRSDNRVNIILRQALKVKENCDYLSIEEITLYWSLNAEVAFSRTAIVSRANIKVDVLIKFSYSTALSSWRSLPR